MGYCTVVMVRSAVNVGDGRQPDDENLSGSPADLDDALIEDAIAEADALIDSYIGSRYAVPAVLVAGTGPQNGESIGPHPIDFWSRNIAAYNAALTHLGSLDVGDNDPRVRRYNTTMLALTAVRDGKATLPLPPVDDGAFGAGTGVGEPVNAYTGNLFTSDEFDLSGLPGGWPFDRGFDGRWPW